MRHSGSYFELTDRFASRAAPKKAAGPLSSPQTGVDHDSPAPESAKSMNCTLVISVAKRLVPSAVRRNTVKRVVREAWRAALRDVRVPGPVGDLDPRAGQPALVCLMRLKRYPGEVPRKAKPAQGRRQAASSAPATLTPVAARAPGVASPGIASVKRALRADADRLFGAFLLERPKPPGTRVPDSRK